MSTELTVNRPSFLADAPVDQDELREMGKFCSPPRLKIIQALTEAPFKPPFQDGDAIVVPQLIKIGDANTPFTFTPVLFYATYVCWNPAQMKQQLPAIREVTTDENSEVARKARNFVREKCPENTAFELKYAQMLNFIIVVQGIPDVEDMPIAAFFNRGEFKTGQSLIGLIQARKAPGYACRFRAGTGIHSGKVGKWYGLNIENAPEPWVSESEFSKYQNLNSELKKLQASKQLQVDLNDSDVPSDDDGKF